uniref:ubiquitinyl hydrolase 1 n=1 Tax=Oncorhynchus kisutch TaxID=8019 RepID=A0A8C7DIN1_ONCKI
PEASALFLPANQIKLRRWSRANDDHHINALPPQPQPPIGNIIARTVRFCGALPGRTSTGVFVGILLDNAVGNWDGSYKGEKLCSISSSLYGCLLPISKVSPEPRSRRHTPPLQNPKPVLKPTLPPAPVSSPASTPKIALMPPQLLSAKLALKPPPLPSPKPFMKPHPLPPTPPTIKPQTLPSPTATDQPQLLNGSPGPLSPGRGDGLDAEENGDAGLEVELEVGSMVEVNDPPLFGVIRWIGRIIGVSQLVSGIELDQELTAGTDGSYLGERHFRCPANKGLFVKLRNCRRDSRFPAPETPVNQVERCNSIAFAEWGSERVEEHTPPVQGDEARDMYQGWKRGIQGHLNSCYLDASLFSLFSCCSSVDWVLLWPSNPSDGPHCSQAQDLLRCEIVNPLRRCVCVCILSLLPLPLFLSPPLSFSYSFLQTLSLLLPLVPFRSVTQNQQPQECHLYQLFPPSVPLSPSSPVPLVQTLLETSFLHAGLKFAEAPSCLPLLMPRFGKDFKMFDAILPSLTIDITDLLDDTLRQCSICQAVAEWECLECYDDLDITPGRLKQYCHTCNTQVHIHKKRQSHSPCQVGVAGGPWTGPLHGTRQRLSLFAVTCIETSHYVSFVKHGPRPNDWLFFDSMADREGGENGFNIPQVRACPEVGRYLSLSAEELGRLDPASLRESARRLLCDSYMCLYHSPELSLYK